MLRAEMPAPLELDGAAVIRRAKVTADVLPTGRTRHIRDGEAEGAFAQLAIARYPDGAGYYLLCLDAEGAVVTDTYHDSVEAAVEQADYEFIGLAWLAPDDG